MPCIHGHGRKHLWVFSAGLAFCPPSDHIVYLSYVYSGLILLAWQPWLKNDSHTKVKTHMGMTIMEIELLAKLKKLIDFAWYIRVVRLLISHIYLKFCGVVKRSSTDSETSCQLVGSLHLQVQVIVFTVKSLTPRSLFRWSTGEYGECSNLFTVFRFKLSLSATLALVFTHQKVLAKHMAIMLWSNYSDKKSQAEQSTKRSCTYFLASWDKRHTATPAAFG